MPPDYREYEPLTDQELIVAMTSGDGNAVQFFLTERCGKFLKYFCECYPAARMDIGDLAHDVFRILAKNDWNTLRSFQGENKATGRTCTLKSYVQVIARNHIAKKNQKNLPEIDWTSALNDDEGNWLEVPDKKASQEYPEGILRALMTLSPEERLVIVQFKIKGHTAEEVAEMLSKNTKYRGTPENVHTICYRARKNLRDLLDQGGVYA